MTLPEGGVMCYSQMLEGDDTTRQVEFLNLDPRTTYDLWKKTLAASGWQLDTTNDTERKYEIAATKEGFSANIVVSKSETNKGWSTVRFQ